MSRHSPGHHLEALQVSACIPQAGPIDSWRRALMLLLAAAVLTALTSIMMIKRVELRAALHAARGVTLPVQLIEGKSTAQAVYLQTLRTQDGIPYREYSDALQWVGFWHMLAAPLILTFLLWSMQRFDAEVFSVRPLLAGKVARICIIVICVNFLVLLLRFGWVPLVDWSWESLGNGVVAYEHAPIVGNKKYSPGHYGNGMSHAALAWIGVGMLLDFANRFIIGNLPGRGR